MTPNVNKYFERLVRDFLFSALPDSLDPLQFAYCHVSIDNPVLYSVYTYDCTATNSSNIIVKFADNTTVVVLITNSNETAYRVVSTLTHFQCCKD